MLTRPLRTRLRGATEHEEAAEHLHFIRATLERAGAFTAVAGWGQVVVGVIGVIAGLVAVRQTTPGAWIATWLTAATIGAAVGAVAITRKAQRLGLPLFSGPTRRFALTFIPPLVAGAWLTLVLYRAGLIGLMPGTWLLLFGTGVLTGGALSVRVVPVMGLCFMALGVTAFLAPDAWANWLLIAGFGGVLIAFGIIIAIKHGG